MRSEGEAKMAGEHRVCVILGAQWGDEGKGKLVDLLGRQMDVVARCAGGNNAGHTVVVGDRVYDFHLLPCGLMHDGCTGVIGSGVVVHLPGLFAEIEKNGIQGWEKRLLISDRAHVVLDVHQAVDGLNEAAASAAAQGGFIGTTKKGIGPTYSTKAWRNGIRMGTLVGDEAAFRSKFADVVAYFTRHFPGLQLDTQAELERLMAFRARLLELSLVTDTRVFLNEALQTGKAVLIEGANGTLLDLDHGTYPFVTSSSCCVGGVCTGLGLPPRAIGQVIGIAKAYQTRVGDGPFPTELATKEAEALRSIGGEFGVTTGRPRRCGHLDLVLLRYSAELNGFSAIALTKLDCLDTFQVPLGTASDGTTPGH